MPGRRWVLVRESLCLVASRQRQGGAARLVRPHTLPSLQPWCEMMQQDRVALRFWKAEGVLHYTCVDTGALRCAVL